MKRLIWLILALLLLTGCTVSPVETTPSTEATEPPGIYQPGHALENQSSGAIRVFPLEDSADAIAFMGSTLVTFRQEGGKTVVTPYLGQNLTQQTGATLDGTFLPNDKVIRLDQQRIGYYDQESKSVVLLDSGLQETGRVRMPQDMVGLPVISETLATVFYCNGSEVRALSLESGINRLLRRQNCQALSVEASFFADSVLMCAVMDNDGNSYVEFISSQTGESFGADNAFTALDVWQNQYFLQRQDHLVTEYLFTADDGSQQCFHPKSDLSQVYSLLAVNCAATVTQEVGGVHLEVFDLFSGKAAGQILLEGVADIHSLTADPEQDAVWFLATDEATGKTVLCSWDFESSPVADDAVYTAPRYTLKNPDTAGLAACRTYADSLEDRFGVEIAFGSEPLHASDYSLIFEHQPTVIQNALEQLEKALSVFPEDFFKIVSEVSDSEKIHIGLVRGLKRKNTGVPEGIDAYQYWVDGNAWMALPVGDTVDQMFIHELAHVLDTFVYSKNVSYDEWSKLNPKDFSYDLSYSQYKDRTDSQYLSGKKRAFVDSYSMTYPKEDRARIFDCALAEGNAELFASETMQAKLRQFCVGLRNACGWKKDERTFPWEQYLTKSLAYTKK